MAHFSDRLFYLGLTVLTVTLLYFAFSVHYLLGFITLGFVLMILGYILDE